MVVMALPAVGAGQQPAMTDASPKDKARQTAVGITVRLTTATAQGRGPTATIKKQLTAQQFAMVCHAREGRAECCDSKAGHQQHREQSSHVGGKDRAALHDGDGQEGK